MSVSRTAPEASGASFEIARTDDGPVCVLGCIGAARRSWRALNLLGMDLGPEETMLDPIEHDNPTGFWEQAAMMERNGLI